MNISFATQKAADAAAGEKNGTYSVMKQIIRRSLGKNTPCKYTDIISVLDELAAADTCADLPPSIKPHPLRGNKKGCFAVNIRIAGQGGRGRIRLVFRPDHDDDPGFRIDNYRTIERVVVEELCTDYHEH